MPEPLKEHEVKSQTDATVAKQYDDETPTDKKFEDFYSVADRLRICMMGTYRKSVGPVARAMAVAKRTGPDFLFLANKDSRKFQDLDQHQETTLIFLDSKKMDWASVTGEATVRSNDDPRIKEIWSKATGAWFGDLGDGVHTGGPEDPRMTLIEVKPKFISYWVSEVGTLGFIKEVAGAVITGGVANNGSIREMSREDIDQARKKGSSLTS